MALCSSLQVRPLLLCRQWIPRKDHLCFDPYSLYILLGKLPLVDAIASPCWMPLSSNMAKYRVPYRKGKMLLEHAWRMDGTSGSPHAKENKRIYIFSWSSIKLKIRMLRKNIFCTENRNWIFPCFYFIYHDHGIAKTAIKIIYCFFFEKCSLSYYSLSSSVSKIFWYVFKKVPFFETSEFKSIYFSLKSFFPKFTVSIARNKISNTLIETKTSRIRKTTASGLPAVKINRHS